MSVRISSTEALTSTDKRHVDLNQNNIVGNSGFGILNDSVVLTNAVNNFWGAVRRARTGRTGIRRYCQCKCRFQSFCCSSCRLRSRAACSGRNCRYDHKRRLATGERNLRSYGFVHGVHSDGRFGELQFHGASGRRKLPGHAFDDR